MSEWFEIIVLGAIAAFIIMRLFSVLGRKVDVIRTDETSARKTFWNEVSSSSKTVDRSQQQTSVKVPETFPAPPSRLAGLRKQVAQLMSDFHEDDFMYGACQAFVMIFNAYSRCQLATVAHLMNKDIFRSWTKALKSGSDSVRMTLKRVVSAEMRDVVIEGQSVLVTVAFVSEQQKVDPLGPVEEVDDVWIFARDTASQSPDWILVQTA
jgi:predicted lipid-binding transport protein (Tim44 family)